MSSFKNIKIQLEDNASYYAYKKLVFQDHISTQYNAKKTQTVTNATVYIFDRTK